MLMCLKKKAKKLIDKWYVYVLAFGLFLWKGNGEFLEGFLKIWSHVRLESL